MAINSVGGSIGQTAGGAVANAAIGPGTSVAGDLASFANTDGVTLADSGTKVAPIFSTAATGVSMANAGTNTVLVGPVSMVTPGANGTYRFNIQVVQTTAGSGGTCAAGTLGVSLSYKDADSAVTYAFAAAGQLLMSPQSSATYAATCAMAIGATGAANNFQAIARDFRAASGVAVQYEVVQIVNSNCTTPPVFAARPALYYLGY